MPNKLLTVDVIRAIEKRPENKFVLLSRAKQALATNRLAPSLSNLFKECGDF